MQLAIEILNDLQQQKTKTLLKGLSQKAYKPEEKEQKLSAAKGDVHREFKKWRVNYSENRLCKNLMDHHEEKKNPRTPGVFLFCVSKFLPIEKRDAAFLRQKVQVANPKVGLLQRSQK